ncbi:uncharacterized protein SRS1_11707 [Sporisorium reilianum f. sp. reilianum]|uniref:Selenoprotein O n=1 Tax=Sporisorium reilianum f. sp. reilianum TaxID=72559 RepID=A0A2N8U7X8_9BASI|nr:uncharacterized protein SRS1_11707 [Sporisorium reilianum f. sp. reilianum]
MRVRRFDILNLPLVPPSERLTVNLLADPVTPEPRSIVSVPDSAPSLVRRSRPVGQGSHFSFLSTLPLSFPYDFPPEKEGEPSLGDRHQKELEQDDQDDAHLTEGQKRQKVERAHKKRMQEVEHMLQRYEVQPFEVAADAEAPTGLAGHVPPRRRHQHFPSARLLGVSPAALRDCLPHLDVGDSFQWIQSHNKQAGPSSYSSGPIADASASDASTSPEAAARKTLSDFVSGRLIGARIAANPDELEKDDRAGYGKKYMRTREKVIKGEQQEEPSEDRVLRRLDELEQKRAAATDSTDYAPWSLCYAGHQFGVWAGQLGDGRAFTLMETKNPETGERWEIQLKGAGRTPYSRFADGLATLTSSVREYLCSEAMGALGIPTSRALAVVALPELHVIRERLNMAAITTRLCESWLRIGSFQIHSSRAEWESVRILGEYVAHDLFGFSDVVKGGNVGDEAQRPEWVRRMVEQVATRNAKTIGLWQVYGFMHGVMNTDNIALTGHTIDYGPYAFMDLYDEGQICNHSDSEGRYAYRLQPTMGVFAIRELLNAVAPLVGFEIEHKRAPAPGELLAATDAQIDEWRELCSDEYSDELEHVFTSTLLEQWKQAYRGRLGLKTAEADDKAALINPLSDVLSDLDFATTLRRLCRFPALLKARRATLDDEDKLKDAVGAFIAGDAAAGAEPWYDESILPEYLRAQKQTQARTWLSTYARRLLKEGRDGDEVTAEMRGKNPRFVLRNWVTNEVAKRLEEDNDTDVLAKVLEMATRPFEDWGLPAEGKSAEEVAEEARLCSIGRPLTGNLPSCSS